MFSRPRAQLINTFLHQCNQQLMFFLYFLLLCYYPYVLLPLLIVYVYSHSVSTKVLLLTCSYIIHLSNFQNKCNDMCSLITTKSLPNIQTTNCWSFSKKLIQKRIQNSGTVFYIRQGTLELNKITRYSGFTDICMSLKLISTKDLHLYVYARILSTQVHQIFS